MLCVCTLYVIYLFQRKKFISTTHLDVLLKRLAVFFFSDWLSVTNRLPLILNLKKIFEMENVCLQNYLILFSLPYNAIFLLV